MELKNLRIFSGLDGLVLFAQGSKGIPIPGLLVQINQSDSRTVGQSYQFEAIYLNTIGQEQPTEIQWSSSDTEILTIDDFGLANGIKTGISTIRAEAESLSEEFQVVVTEEEVVNTGGSTARTGTIRTTSSYTLKGAFTLKEEGDDLLLEFTDDYSASSNLPGLYVYLSNNPNSTSGAFEIGEVEVFSGAHSYTISGVGLQQFSHLLYYCKPFAVKVGDGELSD